MHLVGISEGTRPLIGFRRNREGNIKIYLKEGVKVWAAFM